MNTGDYTTDSFIGRTPRPTKPEVKERIKALARRAEDLEEQQLFVSSRRRHTICLSDWSSDVCSSDQIFISSRRRHTRCLSDWSSDVCSSDLGEDGIAVDGDAEFAEG